MKKNKSNRTQRRQPTSGKVHEPASPSVAKRSLASRRQYPDKVGYHGTDEERDLNPEE